MSDDTAIELPPRRMLADDVYDAIRRSIATNRLASGAKINLDQIAREVGVSNTPIRQALSRLEAEGLVEKTPYRGYTVTNLRDTSRLEYVFEARLIVETAVAGLAATRRTEALLERLQDYVDRAEHDLTRAGALDSEFHLTIADATSNPMLREQVERLVYGTTPTSVAYDAQGSARPAWQEHAEILAQVRKGEPDAAREAMRRHLESSRDRFRHILERTPEA